MIRVSEIVDDDKRNDYKSEISKREISINIDFEMIFLKENTTK